MKHITYIFVLLATFVLAACVNFDDATGNVATNIQLSAPSEYPALDLSGRTVTITANGTSISTTTDANGVAHFSSLIPDVYDISVSWHLTSAEYSALTGSKEANSGATVSGSLNGYMIGNSEPIVLNTLISLKRDIVIGKIYAAGAKDNNNRNYRAGRYIELYNQSDDTINVAGLYVGLLETDNPQAFTLKNLHDEYADSVVVLKQAFRIPNDQPFLVAPGGTVLMALSAIDHSVNAPLEHSLLDADFETKDKSGTFQNNPDTKELINAFNIYSGASTFNILQSGQGVVIFRTTEDVTTWKRTYKYGKKSGTMFTLMPKRYIIDGVEYLRNKSTGQDMGEKRLYSDIDAGSALQNTINGWSGEVVYRKISGTGTAGQKILMDTNNSSNDFQVSTTIAPRQYD